MSQTFKALVVRQDGTNFTRSIEQRNIDDLPKGDVLIRVHFSSLNYKDGLSCSGNRTVTRHYPHTPGIDAAGIVEFSCVDDFKVGDSVVVNLKEGKIGKVLPVKKDSQVLIVKGKHMGRNGKILSLEDDEVLINTGDGDIKIQEEELIVLN